MGEKTMTFSTPGRENHRKREIHSHGGFTLVELLISLSILSIIIAVAVPELRNYIHQNRFRGAIMDVLASIRQARSAAVEKNRSIVFKVDVIERTYQAFQDDGAGSADADSDGLPDNARNSQLDAGEQIVLSGSLPKGVSFTGANFGGLRYFHFDGRGFPFDDANVLTNGLVMLSGQTGASATVELISSGHSRVR